MSSTQSNTKEPILSSIKKGVLSIVLAVRNNNGAVQSLAVISGVQLVIQENIDEIQGTARNIQGPYFYNTYVITPEDDYETMYSRGIQIQSPAKTADTNNSVVSKDNPIDIQIYMIFIQSTVKISDSGTNNSNTSASTSNISLQLHRYINNVPVMDMTQDSGSCSLTQAVLNYDFKVYGHKLCPPKGTTGTEDTVSEESNPNVMNNTTMPTKTTPILTPVIMNLQYMYDQSDSNPWEIEIGSNVLEPGSINESVQSYELHCIVNYNSHAGKNTFTYVIYVR